MSTREFIALGTNSQAPTRHRAHNSAALRWDDQLILFDPGENTQRQAILSGVNISRLTAICITHFHGDHCLGLPGVIQRRSLNNATGAPSPELPVYFPGQDQEYFERLRHASIFNDVSAVTQHPVHNDGFVAQVGELSLHAKALEHRVPTFGYRLTESDSIQFDASALKAKGLKGETVGTLLKQGQVTVEGKTVKLEEVSRPKKGQSMAFVMDTKPCPAAEELAEGVDLLVCESTFANAEADLADEYLHMTAGQAGQLARDSGARRLVLTHFSARYGDLSILEEQASVYHHDVVIAKDTMKVPMPKRS